MKNPNIVKGILAGLIGGIVATAVKSIVERIYPPRVEGQPDPTQLLAEKVTAGSLTEGQEEAAAEAIHWGFGAAAGAAYGALVEYYPAAASQNGAGFGVALMGLTHESTLPALGLTEQPEDQTTREQSSEAMTHVVYGVVTETVRSLVRKLL